MDFEIPSTGQQILFKSHLDDKRNERIIFSGLFGIGKTYFIESFFRAFSKEYVSILLSPVDYSVSANADVYQIIKYDILYEMLFKHNMQLDYSEADRGIAIGLEIQQNAASIIDTAIGFMSLLNKEAPDITPVLTLSNTLANKLDNIDKKRKDLTENYKVMEFVKNTDKLYTLEYDFISEFIQDGLDKLASSDDTNKKKVLVIDDLDRIDPEHIFRIFNIFSSHLNYGKGNTNKFGFDKIIFVCDINNIRNIFQSKYGADVDFSGYIDKFYSTEVYHFDNNEEAARFSSKILRAINFGKYSEFANDFVLGRDNDGFLTFLITELMNSGSLSLRRLKSMYNSSFEYKEKVVYFPSSSKQIKNFQVPAVVSFEVLVWLYGDINALDKALKKLRKFGRSAEYYRDSSGDKDYWYAGMLIAILGHKQHSFEVVPDNSTSNAEFENTEKDIKIQYDLKSYGYRRNQYFCDLKKVNNQTGMNLDVDVLGLVYQAFTFLRDTNYLK